MDPNLLTDEDEVTDETEVDSDETEDVESEEEEEEIEIKDEEEDEVKLATPFKKQELLKTYPDLFKKYPYLEKASYGYQQFVDLFGTVDEAREIHDKAESLDEHEAALSSGSLESILEAAKSNDEKAFGKIVDNYLDNLYKVDKEAHTGVVVNVLRDILTTAANGAKQGSNQDLMDAVNTLGNYFFGGPPPPRKAKADTNEVDEERKQFNQERFEAAQEDVGQKIENQLKSTVDSAIDPKNQMTSYVKRNAVKEVLSVLDGKLSDDNDFMASVDKLWERAGKNRYNQQSIKQIRSAVLSKAKVLLPSVIKSVRNEALKGLSRKVTEKKTVSVSRNTSNNRTSKTTNDDGRGLSTIDYFMQDD
jgi:hypothetical protein